MATFAAKPVVVKSPVSVRKMYVSDDGNLAVVERRFSFGDAEFKDPRWQAMKRRVGEPDAWDLLAVKRSRRAAEKVCAGVTLLFDRRAAMLKAAVVTELATRTAAAKKAWATRRANVPAPAPAALVTVLSDDEKAAIRHNWSDAPTQASVEKYRWAYKFLSED